MKRERKLKNRIYDLCLSKLAPHGVFRIRQIEDFFVWISTLNDKSVQKIDQKIGNIRVRQINFDDKEEGFTACITVVQSTNNDMIAIDVDFPEEEEDV